MSIVAVFEIPTMSVEKYNTTVKQLSDAGAGAPKGRVYHVASKLGSGTQVVDVWNSQEEFDQFGKTLMPIMQAAGVTIPQPRITEVLNVIKG